jgi:tetratricopeptide (TPR) repeat protein
MPDWGRYRERYLEGDTEARNLERLQTMEGWLSLPPEQCAAGAQETYRGQSEDALRPWYQLSRALYLKLLNDAGIRGPDTAQQERALHAAYLSGTASPEDRRVALGLFNVWQIGEALTSLYAGISQLSAGALAGTATREKIGPIAVRLRSLNTAPGLVNTATVGTLKEILGEFDGLCKEAAPDNTGRPDALFYCGETALALADASANLGDSAEALKWYERSSGFFEEAGERERAGQSRKKAAALELQITGDIDRATQRILGPLFQPQRPPDPLSMATAYAELIQAMQDAGDGFGAGETARRAAAAFEKLGFQDPEQVGQEAALDSWVARGCDLAPGHGLFDLLMNVCHAYLSVSGGRAVAYAASDPARAGRNEELAAGMDAVVQRICAETQAAKDSLARAIQVYFPLAPAPAEPPLFDPAFAQMQQGLRQMDEALLRVRQTAVELRSAGQSLQPALDMLDRLEPAVKAIAMPLYHAYWKLGYAYTYMVAGESQKALEAADEARTAVLGGRPAKLSSLKTYERAVYLEAQGQRVRALMTLGQLKDGLAACLETIADFEESRYRVNSPLRQSTLLKSTVEFYIGAAFAAFKLKEWDTLLQVTELVKARSAIRSRLSADVPDLEIEELEKQFTQITAALQNAGQGQDREKVEELTGRRRDLWDLLAIARARAAGAAQPPLLSVAALQAVLAPDEAALGYFFLAPAVLLVMRMDSRRFDVERVLFDEESMTPVNDLLEAIENLDRSGPLDLDEAIAAAGQVLLPAGVREFLDGKARVIISPHHGLHLFPFHAASWDGKFLIERYAVRYVPNFSSMLLEWRGQVGTGAFALGVGRFEVAGQEWPELKNTEEQARQIASIYEGLSLKADTLTGEAASTDAFRELAAAGGLSGYSALHLATHGTSVFASETQDEPMESKLVLRNGSIDGLELATFRLPADVAVLSACNSGQRAVGGRGMSELPGDDIFGLQSALFQAGVHTVLGSLWPVETTAAYQTTLEFHSHYAKGDPPELALRKAMLNLCSANGGAGTFRWAPFFLSSLGTARMAQPVH